MAEQQQTIFIDVQFKADEVAKNLSLVTSRIASMKEQSKELTKAINEGNDADGQMSMELAHLQKEIAGATAEQKALQGQLQQTMAANSGLGDSFREMDAQLRQLENQYKSLSKAQRDSAKGEQLKQAIIKQKQALKDFDAELGNYQRNVGNYSNSILDAFSKLPNSMQRVVNPVKNVTLGFKALSATPAIAILNVLATILLKLSDRFKQNGAAMESLTGVFGAFEGVGQMVNKLIDKIAEGVGWLAERALKLADRIGLVTDTMKESQAIAQAELAMQAEVRKNARLNAEDAKKIADLRAQANDKQKTSTREQIQLMQQAADLEQEVARRTYEQAQKAYELQQRKNEQSNSSQEDLNKENELYIQMITAQTAYLNKQRELNGQMSALREKAAADAKAAAAVRLEIERGVEDALLELQEDGTAKQIAQIKLQGEREVENLKVKLNSLKQTDIKAREELQRLIVAKEQQTAKKVEQILIESENNRAKLMRENALKWLTMGESDRLRVAQAELQNAQETYRSLYMMTEQQWKTIYQTEEQYNAALLDAESKMLQAHETLRKESYERELLQQQNDFAARLQKAQGDDLQIAEIEYQQAVTQAERLKLLDQETKEALYGNEDAYKQAVIAAEGEIQAKQQQVRDAEMKRATETANAISSMLGSLGSVFDEYSEQSKAAAVASKAIALGQIAIDTGTAIAGGVSQAMSVPFPANLAAIATTIATVMANILTAKKTIESAKFETGGIVGGTSYTGDRVPVAANSGEMIITREQQTKLFDAISSGNLMGSNYDMMAAAMSTALAQMKAPVMVYSEFKDFERQVSQYNEFTSL